MANLKIHLRAAEAHHDAARAVDRAREHRGRNGTREAEQRARGATVAATRAAVRLCPDQQAADYAVTAWRAGWKDAAYAHKMAGQAHLAAARNGSRAR